MNVQAKVKVQLAHRRQLTTISSTRAPNERTWVARRCTMIVAPVMSSLFWGLLRGKGIL